MSRGRSDQYQQTLPTMVNLGRGCIAVGDVLVGVDLLRWTARAACQATAKEEKASPEQRQAAQDALVQLDPVPASSTRPLPAERANAASIRESLEALGKLVEGAFRDAVVLHWSRLESATTIARRSILSLPPGAHIAADGSDPDLLLRCAFEALSAVLEVRRVPPVCEAIPADRPFAPDKPWLCTQTALSDAEGGQSSASGSQSLRWQDGGLAIDFAWVHAARLPLAKVLLPKDARQPFYMRAAEEVFWRGDAPRAEAIIRESLAENPSSEAHNALLRYMLASPASNEERFYEESRRWCDTYANESQLANLTFANERDPNRVLRLGFVCDFLHSQIATHTLLPQFRAHNRDVVNIYVYNTGVPAPELEGECDVAHRCQGSTVDELESLIRDDQIDILFDLNGRLREDYQYELFCRKPAPILVNWYNLVETIGMRAYDAIIGDDVSLPRDRQPYYVEQICHLPSIGTWQLPETPAVAPLPSMTRGIFTFGCFGSAFKLNPAVLELWAALIAQLPDAVLYLKNLHFYTYQFKQHIRGFFLERGVKQEQLRLEHGSRFDEMRNLYSQVDLALDTFPYNNGSTNISALWQGVPIITLSGSEFRSRITTSMQLKAGLDGFVVSDPEAYIERAVHYYHHRDELAQIRQNMRSKLLQTGYFRPDQYATALEQQCRDLWCKWLERQQEAAA